jgi:hypothetical protein
MRRSSALWGIVFALVTGGMGILAGYGALRLWHDHQMAASADNRADQAPPMTPAPTAPALPASTARRSQAPQKAASRRSNAPRRSVPPPAKIADQATSQPARSEPDPSPQPPTPSTPSPPSVAAAAKSPPRHVVDLDLTKNRQQQVIEATAKDLRVVELEGCDVEYELKPALIVIKGPRDIVVNVSFDTRQSGKTLLELEPVVTTDAGKKMPFTVRNMDNIRRQLGLTGEQATAALAAMKQEQKALEDFLQNAGPRKTAKQDAAARARVDQLKKLIPPANAQLKALQTDYDVAAKMFELAESLNEKCRILLEEAGSEAAQASYQPQNGASK